MRQETTVPPDPTAARATPRNPSRLFWPAVCLLVGGLGLWLAGHMTLLQWDNDEGIFAISGWAVASGYRPFADFWVDQPPGGALLLALVYRLAGPSLAAARGLTLALSLAGVVGVALLARRLGGGIGGAIGGVVAGLAAIPLLILSPHFFWLSRSLNMDLPGLALGVLALDAAWRYRDSGWRRWLVAAGLLLGLGISLKLHALLLGVPIGLLLVQRAWAEASAQDEGRPIAQDDRVPLTRHWPTILARTLRDSAILAVGVLACAATWFLTAPAAAVIDGIFGVMARARAVYPARTAEYADWLFRENLLGENLGLAALALFGLAWLARRRPADAAVMAAWCAVVGLALVTQRPMWPKHHWSVVLWPLAVLAGVGVAGLVDLVRGVLRSDGEGEIGGAGTTPEDGRGRAMRPRAWLLVGALALAVWLAALPGTVQRLRDLANPRQFSAVVAGLTWIGENLAPDATVISDNGLLPFLTGRRTPPELAIISSKRTAIGDLTGADLIRSAELSQAAAVMIWNNHLTDFAEFMAYLPTRYIHVHTVGDDREIWQRFDPAEIAFPQPATIFDVAQLEGYRLSGAPPRTSPGTPARAGQPLPLTLYWRAVGPTPADLTVFVHLVDAEGRTVAQADGPPAGGKQPSSDWVAGEIVIDPRTVDLPADLGPGTYRLHVGFYDPATLQRLGAGRPDGSLWPEGAVVLDTPVDIAP
jgi:hypothetical protein